METTEEKVAVPIAATYANDVLKTIYTRRATRKYKDQPIPRELIQQVIEAGRMAPSAINKQPWRFYILTDKERIKQFSKEIVKAGAMDMIKSGVKNIVKTAVGYFHFPKGMDMLKEPDPIFHGAPVIIFMASPRDNEWAPLDVGMCCQNMMLAAKSLGLDSCPVGMAKFVEHAKSFSTLTIPKSEQVDLAIILGYGNESPIVHERAKDNAVYL